MRTARAPGRVNLIGDHTDTTGGLALPCAIDLGIAIEFFPGGDVLDITSDAQPGPARVPVPVITAAHDDDGPPWARTVRSAARALETTVGGTGRVRATLPVGVGLSSSAAFTVALLLALGFDGSKEDLVLLAQRVEQDASGVPCGLLDQLAVVHGVAGAVLRVDTTSLEAPAVPVPDGASIIVAPSGEVRSLSGSPYAKRAAEVQAADEQLGGLRLGAIDAWRRLDDPVLARRARHVLTENERVDRVVTALRAGDLADCGAAMTESHASLRDDFEVSTCALDALVNALVAQRGVFGARLTGAGFGGCAVALVATETAPEIAEMFHGWVVTPSAGASVF